MGRGFKNREVRVGRDMGAAPSQQGAMEEAARSTGKEDELAQEEPAWRPPEAHKKVPPPVDTLKAREVWGLGMRHQ